MSNHVEKLLNHQRDILARKAIEEVESAVKGSRRAIKESADREALEKEMKSLEESANKWLKPYPNATWRENIEVLLVALAVAMGVRTFFLQPFKIPTGSMQPTLFGVVSQNLRDRPDLKVPTGWERVKEWFQGISYLRIAADENGTFEGADPPIRLLIFNLYQRIHFAGRTYSIWFPPDYGSPPHTPGDTRSDLEVRAGLTPGQEFHRGDDIVKLVIRAGDHLFVDRFTYNFRQPKRGEIIVFETKGIPEDKRNDEPLHRWGIPPDQFYIKRLVGLGGERIRIGDDRHLVIDGKRLDKDTPHFQNVYSFDTNQAPRESQYSGHVSHVPLFPDNSATYKISANHYFVMGDNTVNSLDSRYWGEFPCTSVIGRACFVYWPLSDRFGWSCLNR